MHERTTVSEKSFCFFSSSLSFRWWVLWSRTPLHVALSCTTSSSRSLLLWRTTSTSAAVRPEPESVICFFFFFPNSHLSPADSCLFPDKSYLEMMPTEAKAFPKVSLFLKRHEKWKGKGLKPLQHHFLFSSVFFFFADLRMPRTDPKCFPKTQTDLQSGSTLQGAWRSFTLLDVTVSGTYR